MGLAGKVNGPCKMICTGCFGVCWILLLVATYMLHQAIEVLVPEIVDLPDNLRAGFYDGFGFKTLQEEAEKIQASASAALAKCDVVAANAGCDNPVSPWLKESDTEAELAAIQASFAATLDQINAVVSDKYLGVEQFQETADSLNNITGEVDKVQAELDKYPGGNPPCEATNQLYCGMYGASIALVNGTGAVFAQIDTFVDGKEVKQFKDMAGLLSLLHALPYVLWISMFFFTCFWMVDKPACCCCSTNKGAGVAYCFHLFLWFFFFIVTVIFCGIGYGIKEGGKTQKMTGVLKNDPTLVEFIDHLETEYPGFYNVVLRDLIAGMAAFLNAFTGLAIIVIFILGYGCGICCTCGKPYYSADTAKVVDVSAGGAGQK